MPFWSFPKQAMFLLQASHFVMNALLCLHRKGMVHFWKQHSPSIQYIASVFNHFFKSLSILSALFRRTMPTNHCSHSYQTHCQKMNHFPATPTVLSPSFLALLSIFLSFDPPISPPLVWSCCTCASISV